MEELNFFTLNFKKLITGKLKKIIFFVSLLL